MCTISRDSDVTKEKEICLSNEDSISGHRCEGTAMVAICEMFLNCSENIIFICRNKYDSQTWNTKGIICVHMHFKCVYSFQSFGINTVKQNVCQARNA